MRKILAVFLLITLVVIFASCDKNKEDPTTTLNTNLSASTTNSTTASTTAESPTYILTTSPDKTAPWSETTRFEISTTVEPLTDNYGNIVFTTGDVSRPDVITSVIPTSATTTVPVPVTTTVPSTTKATTTTKPTTTAAEKKPVDVSIYMDSVSSSEEIILDIDSSNWSGDLKANSQNIVVKVDGTALDSKVPCKVTSGKNGDGRQEIIIDLSDQGISEGATVSFTIPESFLVTKNGTQYNNAFTYSVSY